MTLSNQSTVALQSVFDAGVSEEIAGALSGAFGTLTATSFAVSTSGVVPLLVTGAGVSVGANLTMADAKNIAVGTTTGTQIGTSASQKLGFYGATPVVQQTKASHNNWGALSDVVSALANLGLVDQA